MHSDDNESYAHTVAESFVGRVEYAASGSSRIEIDDLDSPNWVGRAVGHYVVTRIDLEVWEVGVILQEGPRAWQYAAANRVIRRAAEGASPVRFEGKNAFAPVLSAEEVRAAQHRLDQMQRRHARLRTPIFLDDDAHVFDNPKVSVLERPRRDGDDLPDDDRPSAKLLRPHTSRLALDHDGAQVYVGEGTEEDSISFAHREQMSGGAWEFPRWVLAERGAAIARRVGSGGRAEWFCGVIPDEVIAVRVNGQFAVMGENVFLIVLDDGAAQDEITLTTATGEHEIRYGPPPGL